MSLLNTTDIYCFSMDYKRVDGNLSPAFIITVLLFYDYSIAMSYCSLHFGFLLIILVLENHKFRSLKSPWILCSEYAVNPEIWIGTHNLESRLELIQGHTFCTKQQIVLWLCTRLVS